MPISGPLRRQILQYCRRDVPSKADVERDYAFIENVDIRSAVVDEYLTARYIYKLGEALAVEKRDLYSHVKFQVIQYASIYEVIIGWMLWEKLAAHPEVRQLQTVKTVRKLSTLPRSIVAETKQGSEVFFATEKELSAPQQKIKFSDKVKTSVSLGFVDKNLAAEIEEFFAARNGIHIENAVKNQIDYELDLAKRAYWRLQPFRVGVSEFLRAGLLPANAKVQHGLQQ
ncbi:hypothetical protein [uncultured Tateyamaria sp.]|uniref:hypothetical protein n=1 Tax=uncultured Tateyamaria sp. TaxID=455651 RepID=UPI00261C31A6|nr:hypothetical protein [uncultured Tateyamaria sp.]